MRTVIPIKQVDKDEYGKDADGWEQMTTLSEPRLSEMAENYRALGHEVEVREVQRREGECNVCFEESGGSKLVSGTLYIRRASRVNHDDASQAITGKTKM